MKVRPDVQAVVFDMDGLLLDTERVYLEAFRRAQLSLGLGIRQDAYFGLVGLNTTDLKIGLDECLPPDANADEFFLKWNVEIAALFEEPIAVKDGARELCIFLKEAGVPRAIATSSDADKASVRLERAGLHEFFSVLVGGDQIHERKARARHLPRSCKAVGN